MDLKYILLLVYNRPEKTRSVLQHLRTTRGIEGYELVVVRQKGNNAVKQLITDIDWIKVHHLETIKKSSVKQSINNNMFHGLQYCFDNCQVKSVIIFEDDILPGYDFLFFCEKMVARYYSNSNFRAVNGFSFEPLNSDELRDYGRFRYGVGWGWCLTDRVWRKIQRFWAGNEDAHFDAILEPFMKSGFVVMPKCSRTLNIGWGEGASHSPQAEDDEVYSKLKNSWVGPDKFQISKYEEKCNMHYTWREDCIPYTEKNIFDKVHNSLYSFFKFKLIILRSYFRNSSQTNHN